MQGGFNVSITFKCRHCTRVIGELDQRIVNTSNLGFDQLSLEEQKEMIKFHHNGDISVYAICESCEVSLEHHPHYHELDYFIH